MTTTKPMTPSENYLVTISGLSARERNEMLAYYHKLAECQRIEIEPIVAKLRNEYNSKMQKDKVAEFWYAIRLRAVKFYRSKEQNFSRKEDMTPENLAELTAIRIKGIKAQMKKPKLKTTLIDIVRVRYDEIKFYRTKGDMTWREIAEYLKQHTATNIHYTYLHECYINIAKELGDLDQIGKPVEPGQ